MRKLELTVPVEVIADFATELTDRQFDNTITGVTDDNEIIIEVKYNKEDEDEAEELETILENLISEMEEDDEEEDNED